MGLAYIKAWATVRDTPTEESQERLLEALEREHEIAAALECEPHEILRRIEDLRNDARDELEEIKVKLKVLAS